MKMLDIQDKKIRLEIWDTGGQERFRTITKSYYERAMAVILAYDCTNVKSFYDIRKWLQQLQENANPAIMKVLVATKCDLKLEKKVDTTTGINQAKKLGLKFFETSAKDNE